MNALLNKIKVFIKKLLLKLKGKNYNDKVSTTPRMYSVVEQSSKNLPLCSDNSYDNMQIGNKDQKSVFFEDNRKDIMTQAIEQEYVEENHLQSTLKEEKHIERNTANEMVVNQMDDKSYETLVQHGQPQGGHEHDDNPENDSNLSSDIEDVNSLSSDHEKNITQALQVLKGQGHIQLNPEEMRQRDKRRLNISENRENILQLPYILTALGSEKAEKYKHIVASVKNKLTAGLNRYGSEFLLGLIVLSDEDYTQLKEMLRIIVNNHRRREAVNDSASTIVSVAMVEIISRELLGDDFWGSIYSAARIKGTQENCNFLKKCLLSCILRHDLYFHYTNNRRNYCSTMAIHSIYNNTNVINFFDFLNDIYIEDLLETYDNTLAREYIKKLISSIEYDLSKDKFVTDSQTSSVSGLYQLTFGQKYSFLHSPKVLEDAVANTLYNINSINFNKKSFKMEPMRFYDGFEKWKEYKFLERLQQNTAENSIRNKGSLKKFFKAYYSIDKDRSLFLNIPEQVIDIEYVYDDIRLNIYIDNALSRDFSRTLKVYGKIIFKTETVSVKLDGFYKNIRYEICSGNTILYDSRDSLYRDFIICNKEFEEITVSKIPHEHIYLITTRSADVVIDDFYNKYDCSNYRVYSIDPGESCSITVEGKTLIAFELDKQSVIAKFTEWQPVTNAKIIYGGLEYAIIKNLSPLKILASDLTSDDIVVEINGVNYILNDISDNIQETSDNGLWSALAVLNGDLIPYGKPVTMNIRSRGESRPYFSARFVLFRNFKIVFEKDIYYNERIAKIEDIYSDDLETGNIDFTKVYNLSESLFVAFAVKMGGYECELVVYMPVIYWEIIGIANAWSNITDIFALDLYENPELKISTPFSEYDLLMCYSNKIETLEPIKNNIFTLKNHIHSEEDYVTIGLIEKHSGKQYKLFDIYYKPTLKNISAEYIQDEKVINFSCSPIGSCTAKLEVTNDIGNEILTSYELSAGTKNAVVPFTAQYGRYFINVYSIEEDEFGFGKKCSFINKLSLIIGDVLLMHAANGMISINEFVGYDEKRYNIPNFHLMNIMPVNEGKYYTATAFYYKKNYDDIIKWYYTKANPVYVNIIMKSEDELHLEIVDKDMDGFIFDKYKEHILYDEGLKGIQLIPPDYYILKI